MHGHTAPSLELLTLAKLSAITPGTGFTVAAAATDLSTYNYLIIDIA